MDSFDLKQFLVENKLTGNSKLNEATYWNKERKEKDPEGYAKYLEKARQARKQYYEKNREKTKQARKQYYEKNREKTKQSAKQYYEKNQEKAKQSAKQYYEKNQEKVKQRIRQYIKQKHEKIKQDPEAYAKYLEKNKQASKQSREKNPEKVKQTNKQFREKNPEYAKQASKQFREKNPEYAKQYYKKNKQNYDSYIKQVSDFFYNTITNNPNPELKNIKDNPKLLTKLYSEFIKKAKQQYKSKNKDFSFMVTENSKLNEIKATPKNTGFVTPKQLATDLVNQTQPDFEEDEYAVISTPISEVNPKFVKYLKSLPVDDDYPNQSGIATFDIVHNNIEWKIMFYLIYVEENSDIYDEDMVVFELSY